MDVFFLLDLAGTAVFAYTGSVAARKQQFHVLGIFYIAVLTAVGGGTIRSVLLKTPELFWIQSSEYLIVITMTVLGSYFIRINTNRLWFYFLDSQSLAVFVALGVSTTLNQGQPLHIAFAMGVLSGIGGGLIRDAITSQPPQALSDRAYPVMMLAAALGSIVAVQFGLEAWTLACLAVLGVVSLTAAIHYYRSGNLIRYNHWQADSSQQPGNKTNRHPANNSGQNLRDNQPAGTGGLHDTPIRERKFNTGQTQSRSIHGKSGRLTLLHAFSVITLAGVAGYYYFNQSISHATSGPSLSGGPKVASPTPSPDFADEKIMYLATLSSINNAIDKQDPIAMAQHIDTAKRNRFADARLEVLISKSDDLNSFNRFLDNAATAFSNNQPEQLETFLTRASNLGFYNSRLDVLQNSLSGLKERRAMELANKNLAADRVNLHVAKAEHELNAGNLKLAKRELDTANSLGAIDEI